MIKSGQGSQPEVTDFERTMRERHEIPLFAAVRLFEEFKKDLAEVLTHPKVIERTEHLGKLLAVDSSIIASLLGADSAVIPSSPAARDAHVASFCALVVEGMERRKSPIAPAELLDHNGRRLDATRNVSLPDIKTGMMRSVLRDAIEQLFLQPKSPTADTLLVEKMLSLVSEKNGDSRTPLTVAFVGAFADLLDSPRFSQPTQLTEAQQLFMTRVFGPAASGRNAPEPILISAIDQAYSSSEICRRHFIRGDRAGLLPQELNRFPIFGSEKQGLALTQALYQIQQNLLPDTLDAGASDLSRLSFNDSRGDWAAPFLSGELAGRLRGHLGPGLTEEMVHRTHNIGLPPLQFLTNVLRDAFKREEQPRTIWPDADYLERSVVTSAQTENRKPR